MAVKALSEFLEEKAREQQLEGRQQRYADWLGAVEGLLSEIRGWLKEADPRENFLEIVEYQVDLAEKGLGGYTVPALKVTFGDTAIEIVPVGRAVVGRVNPNGAPELRPEGRVDIRTSSEKYILYRTIQDGKDRWYVQGKDYKV